MILVFPEPSNRPSAVIYSFQEPKLVNIFDKRRKLRAPVRCQPPDPVNEDRAPISIDQLQIPVADIDLSPVHLTAMPNTALARKEAAELWATTAIPANDNLQLTADLPRNPFGPHR